MSATTLTIDGKLVSARAGATILQAAGEAGVAIPTLCHLGGLEDVGACRLCLVEIAGWSKLLPACTTAAAEGMVVSTAGERVRRYRRMILELLFAERNHVCSVCVSNGSCELQALAWGQGMDHCRYEYLSPRFEVDITHPLFGMDHSRCVLCTRCVRVCAQVEGAGTKDLAGRGARTLVINDLAQPWGSSETCTSCGKCVMSCPTGALFQRGASVAEMRHDRSRLEDLIAARERKPWTA